jgi:hypothetical protein
VRALFEVEVGAPRRNLNSLRSFFLSERFDGGRSAAADLLREDGTASSARFGDTIWCFLADKQREDQWKKRMRDLEKENQRDREGVM